MKSKKKNILEMNKTDFLKIPERKWNEEIGLFDSLIILPTRKLHDSGYRMMDFVACENQKPICRLSGCSDVICLDGIGGRGCELSRYSFDSPVLPKSWQIDCLPKSGLLRLFCNYHHLEAGIAVSTFEIYAIKKED